MKPRLLFIYSLLLATTSNSIAQSLDSYRAPRTLLNRPNFQGKWHAAFATMLERPDGVEDLVVSEEQANEIGQAIYNSIPHNEDPDFSWQEITEMVQVSGEYRSSILVDPADGKLPYLDSIMPDVEFDLTRYETQFDHPEQRPLAERCIPGTFGGPPLFVFPLMLAYQIVQTEKYFLLSAGGPGIRLIYLNSENNNRYIEPSHEGHSRGYWDEDSLVIETTNFREDHPRRSGFGRPLLISTNTKITERFTRLSENELNYYFTVEDDSLYSQPFSGEFSLFTHEAEVYEYGCHEGNYSLPAILRGGQLQAIESDQDSRQ